MNQNNLATLQELADRFGLTKQGMRVRLNTLGIRPAIPGRPGRGCPTRYDIGHLPRSFREALRADRPGPAEEHKTGRSNGGGRPAKRRAGRKSALVFVEQPQPQAVWEVQFMPVDPEDPRSGPPAGPGWEPFHTVCTPTDYAHGSLLYVAWRRRALKVEAT